jgi:DNA-binding MarR family transcriptional regulator
MACGCAPSTSIWHNARAMKKKKQRGPKVHLHDREPAVDLLAGFEPADVLRRLLRMQNQLMTPFTVHLQKRYRLSVNEFRLLMLIGRLGVTASHELAELAGVNTMMVSRGVAVLERHGRIDIDIDPRNLRRKVLRLTPKGRSLYQKMLPSTNRVANYVFEAMSTEEIRAFDTCVKAITARLEAVDERGNSLFLSRTNPD